LEGTCSLAGDRAPHAFFSGEAAFRSCPAPFHHAPLPCSGSAGLRHRRGAAASRPVASGAAEQRGRAEQGSSSQPGREEKWLGLGLLWGIGREVQTLRAAASPCTGTRRQLGDLNGTKEISIFADTGLMLRTGIAEPVAKFLSPSTNPVSPLCLPAPGGQAGPFFFTCNDSDPSAEQDSEVTSAELLLVAWHRLSKHNQVAMPGATTRLELLTESCGSQCRGAATPASARSCWGPEMLAQLHPPLTQQGQTIPGNVSTYLRFLVPFLWRRLCFSVHHSFGYQHVGML